MPRIVYSILTFGLISVISLNIYASNGVVNSRYVTLNTKPLAEQVNPLLAITQYKFPSQINTVGEAIEIVLHQTGYELIEESKQTKYVQLSLKKPLPVTVRSLGPLKTSDALEVLMGKNVFQLVEDPLNRKVDFKIKKEYASKMGAKNVYKKS